MSRKAGKPVNTSRPDGYTFLVTYPPGESSGRPIAKNGMLVLFDTVAIAQQFVPLLGFGRVPHWSNDGETIMFTPFDAEGFNRIDIVTGYDPYNAPVNFAGGIRSETKGREWRDHIMFTHAFFDCGQVQEKGGAVFNTSLPMIAPPTPQRFASVPEI